MEHVGNLFTFLTKKDVVIINYSHCYDKIPGQSNLKKGFLWGPSLRVQSIMERKEQRREQLWPWHQELKDAGQAASKQQAERDGWWGSARCLTSVQSGTPAPWSSTTYIPGGSSLLRQTAPDTPLRCVSPRWFWIQSSWQWRWAVTNVMDGEQEINTHALPLFDFLKQGTFKCKVILIKKFKKEGKKEGTAT